jgi:benzodiazapine receptor
MMSWSRTTLLPIVVAVVGVTVVALAGGLATDTGPWYQELAKPSWQPPDWLFGPAWTTIFALIAAAGVRAWWDSSPGSERQTLLAQFAINGILNVFWSVLFFALRRPDWALAEVVFLWLSILALILTVRRRSPVAAWLLLPYLAWVSFASLLNLAVVRLNPAF